MPEYKSISKSSISYFKKIIPQKGGKRKNSIILSTFNEEKNISRLVKLLQKYMKGNDYQIIIVDDESTDKTPQIIDKLAKSVRIVALHRKGIKGIFSAKRDGVLHSKSDIIVVMDADFSHPPHIVPKLLEHVEDYDIVSGSRYIESGKISAPFRRVFGSKLVNNLARFVLGLKTKDITGGFHAFKKSKFTSLKFKYKSRWEESDIELFYRAEKRGYNIKEIPFVYKFRSRNTLTSKLKDFWYGSRYVYFAIKIKLFG